MANRQGCPACYQYHWTRFWTVIPKRGRSCPVCYEVIQDKDVLPVIWFYSQREEYGEFSNFYPGEQWDSNNHWCDTNEHFFQAAKTMDSKEQAWVTTAATPAIAKQRGRKVKLRVDWGKEQETGRARDYVMMEGIHMKFAQRQECGDLLLSTGPLELREAAPNDHYWGGLNEGDVNRLGQLLMLERQVLQVLRGVPVPKYTPLASLTLLDHLQSCSSLQCLESSAAEPCSSCHRMEAYGKAYISKEVSLA